MLKQLIKFYQISTPAPVLKENKKKLKKLQWATFFPQLPDTVFITFADLV